jgi:predicted transcriptional regulator
MMPQKLPIYWISRKPQLAALASPLRQEIVDVVESAGPCSIARIAHSLGRRPDTLYFHVRRLAAVGLLIQSGTSGRGRQSAAIYDVPGKTMRIRYKPGNGGKAGAVTGVTDSVLRLARRDLKRAMVSPVSILNGPLRDTWAGRVRGWLTQSEVRRLNNLVEEALTLIRGGTIRATARQVALTFVLAPPKGSQSTIPNRKET